MKRPKNKVLRIKRSGRSDIVVSFGLVGDVFILEIESRYPSIGADLSDYATVFSSAHARRIAKFIENNAHLLDWREG